MGRARLERPDNLLRLPGQHAALDVGEVKRLGSRPRRVRQRPRRDALPLVPQRGRPRVDDGRRRARDAADDDRARRASIRREVRVRAEEGETQRLRRRRLRVVVHTSDDIGVELKGVRSGVEMRRGVSGLKARDPGRRESPGEKVFKDRRSPRGRGRTGTGVRKTHLRRCAENSSFWSRSINPLASDSNFSTSKPPNASVPYGDRDGSLAPMATKYTVTCTRS